MAETCELSLAATPRALLMHLADNPVRQGLCAKALGTVHDW